MHFFLRSIHAHHLGFAAAAPPSSVPVPVQPTSACGALSCRTNRAPPTAFRSPRGKLESGVSPKLALDHESISFPPRCNVRASDLARARGAQALSQRRSRGARADLCRPRHSYRVARDVAAHLIANPEQALDTLAREELGLNSDDLGSPIGAALSSFVAFAIGASLPLIPFLLGASNGVIIAAAISGAALFVVGALLSLFSGKNAWLSGLRMPPSAPSRLRRPTASDRCSTSPLLNRAGEFC